MRQPYDRAGPEPRLEELIADPTVRLTMQRDGVSEQELRQVVRDGRVRLGLATRFEAARAAEDQVSRCVKGVKAWCA